MNGGTWPTGDNHATQVVKGGALAEPSAPVKSGHTFDGWYKEAGLTNKVAFPYDVSSVTANITFYAKWTSGGSNPSAVNHNISNATEWNSAIAAVNAAGNDKTHTFTITQSFELTGTNTTIFTKDLSGLNVTIKGQSSPAPEISLASSSAGNLIYFYPSQPQKIILENVVLKGHATNNQPVVSVNVKGELVMEGGARITGNTNTEGYGGAVYLGSTLVMNGGEITGNIAGTSSKTNGRGGGVYMADFAELIIEDGRISGNLAHGQGGAVYVGFVATLKMKGGEISGNTARALSAGARGGGVYNSYGKLYMSGGIITGYGQTHGNDIDITEHYTNDPGQRDACNVVVIGVTAMGIYGAALYNNNGENHYGTFDGETFNEAGSLGSKRERDTKVVDGVLE